MAKFIYKKPTIEWGVPKEKLTLAVMDKLLYMVLTKIGVAKKWDTTREER